MLFISKLTLCQTIYCQCSHEGVFSGDSKKYTKTPNYLKYLCRSNFVTFRSWHAGKALCWMFTYSDLPVTCPSWCRRTYYGIHPSSSATSSFLFRKISITRKINRLPFSISKFQTQLYLIRSKTKQFRSSFRAANWFIKSLLPFLLIFYLRHSRGRIWNTKQNQPTSSNKFKVSS